MPTIGHRTFSLASCLLVLLACSAASAGGGAHGRDDGGTAPVDPGMAAERAARRFPQPVRVGDLDGRLVLEPSVHQTALGHVAGVERSADGTVQIIVNYGGFLGFGSRKIAVPVERTALLGPFLQIVDLDRGQLDALPTWTGAGDTAVAADEQIRVGITRN